MGSPTARGGPGLRNRAPGNSRIVQGPYLARSTTPKQVRRPVGIAFGPGVQQHLFVCSPLLRSTSKTRKQSKKLVEAPAAGWGKLAGAQRLTQVAPSQYLSY